jgi:hypothetical protein
MSHSWTQHLTPEQRATVQEIRVKCGAFHSRNTHNLLAENWWLYLTPSVGPAEYVELRHYLLGGRTARWVIEKDGIISADNDEAELADLRKRSVPTPSS